MVGLCNVHTQNIAKYFSSLNYLHNDTSTVIWGETKTYFGISILFSEFIIFVEKLKKAGKLQ